MKYAKTFSIAFGLGLLFVMASCDKPEVVEPDDKNPGVEIPDTTEQVDTTKPEGPVVPEGSFTILTSFSVDNTPEEGWKTSWLEGEAVNVFSMMGSKPDADESVWTNQGKYVFNPTTADTFVGDVEGRFFSNETYLWHAIYPYSESFVDPSGIEDPHGSEQVLLIGHLPGEHMVQNGYGSTAHLTGTNMPLYGAAYTTGKTTPQFVMHQMAGVINIKVKNAMASSVTVGEVRVEYPYEYLVGRFAVDFGNATSVGHGCNNLYRQAVDASKEVVLKVENPEALASGESADFYLPVMPVQFWKGSQLSVAVGDYAQIIDITTAMSIASGKMRTFNITLEDPLDMKLISPASDATVDLTSSERVDFSWSKVDDNEEYTVMFSGSKNMAKAHEIDVTGTSLSLSAQYFDNMVFPLGIEAGQTGKIYWTVVLRGGKNSAVANSLDVKRRPRDNEARIAETLKIPVAILVEDPVYNGRMEEHKGKRISEITHRGWGYRWNDPYKQMKEYERDMEASSHGVVDYEVVKIVEADQLFSYHRSSLADDLQYLTVDTLVNYYFNYRPTTGNNNVDNAATYDYLGMMKHYGFDKMVDNGEIMEVWVYTHPSSGMYESRLIGDGAFWCNSPGIGAGQATNSRLCCVMFCNYERTTDLAMHSFGHRFESIMSQVYANQGGYSSTAWKYSQKSVSEQLTNWEKYSAHSIEFDKFKSGYAHIGICHYPPNADYDYDYGNLRYVMTYADTWYDYPDIREDDSVARRVNKSEWKDAGGDQWGYMKWYFSHIPHYQGLCPRDGHLNNWWYYLVDYNNAMIYEKQLQAESIKY